MTSNLRRVLVADDDETIRQILDYHLKKAGYELALATNGREAIQLAGDDFACALVDLNMPEAGGLAVLEHFKRNHPDVPVIIISSDSEVKEAVGAMKLGALDYLTKPLVLDVLLALVAQAVRMGKALHESRQWRQAITLALPDFSFTGDSPIVRELLKSIEKVAPLDSTVLITGESGAGKGLLARMIHKASPRQEGPFVTVSCPALPRELIEAEMFGHEKGAFTGAHQRRIGRIEMAEGGTLFLDEIGDLPLLLQPKLLNVLQDLKFQRIGGVQQLAADVRIIAATNVDLQEKIALKEFREDLYYRLNVLPIHVPPLRERVGDLPALEFRILNRIAQARRSEAYEISEEAQTLMRRYPWPGNVRQLENVLERASAFCTGKMIQADDLPDELHHLSSIKPDSADPKADADMPRVAGMTLDDLEKLAIEQTLELCQGNKAAAARRLGITEKTIYNKMTRLRMR
jgi:DNA-binding NtrC family response regulator